MRGRPKTIPAPSWCIQNYLKINSVLNPHFSDLRTEKENFLRTILPPRCIYYLKMNSVTNPTFEIKNRYFLIPPTQFVISLSCKHSFFFLNWVLRKNCWQIFEKQNIMNMIDERSSSSPIFYQIKHVIRDFSSISNIFPKKTTFYYLILDTKFEELFTSRFIL